MRIGGIASGIDTDQMIRDLMRVERVRVDRLLQQEQRVKWRQEAYHDVNRKMANFILNTRKAFSGSDRPINQRTVDNFNWVKSASSSNEGIVRATASAGAMNGNHTVRVESLAEVARVTSTDIKGMLKDDGFTFEEVHFGTFTLKTNVGQTEITIGAGEGEVKTIHDLVRAINNASAEVNGTNVNLGLRAAYDSNLGQLMITTRETGLERHIQITDNENSNFAATVFGDKYASLESGEITGKNSVIYFNDNRIEQSTNNFTVFGINLQLRGADEDTIVNISVDANVNGILEKVQEFVSSYNELIGDINKLLGEKFHKDFPPLTSEQKNAMTEEDIKLWEAKSRSGLLRNDQGVNSILLNMRSSLYKVVDGAIGNFKHITDIGIDTGAYYERGRLVINEDRLRAAISSDPEGVVNLLFKTSTTTIPSSGATEEEIRTATQIRHSESGLIQRIYDDMANGMKDIIRRFGHGTDASLFRTVQSNMLLDFITSGGISSVDREISNISLRVEREERLIAAKEDRYWRQFAALEKAMGQMQQQSMWLSQQMGMF